MSLRIETRYHLDTSLEFRLDLREPGLSRLMQMQASTICEG